MEAARHPAPAAHAQPVAHAPPAEPADPTASAARVRAAAPIAPAAPSASPPVISAPQSAPAAELGAREPAARAAAPAPEASQRASQPQRLRGVVKWFGDRGYGFIAGEDGRDVFVHRSALSRGMFPRLIEGQLVEYEVQQSPKGLQAVEVMPLHAGRER